MVYSDLILSETSLISYWKLDETHNNIAIDSKDSNNGTYNNCVLNQILTPSYINGKLDIENTYEFVSSNTQFNIKNLKSSVLFRQSYINISDASNLHLSNITLEVWVNTKSVSRQTIFSKCNVGGTGFILRIYQNYIEIYIGNNITISSFFTPLNGSNGQINFGWNYIVGTISSGGIIKIYLNGLLIFDQTVTISLSNTESLFIGKSNNNTNYFNGYLMHCAIYNQVLNYEQITKHWLAAVRTDFFDTIENETILLHNYRFMEQCNSDFSLTGNTIIDSKSTNDGVYNSSNFISTINGIELNEGEIQIPHVSGILTGLTFTIELIIENLTIDSLDFISKGNGLRIHYDATRGLAIWTGSEFVFNGSNYPFTYLALTYDIDGNLLCYTDGFQQPLFDIEGYSISYPITINYSNSSDILITARSTNFKIKHLAIYSDALSISKIREHYIKYIGLTKYQELILSESELQTFLPLRNENSFYRTMSIYGVNAFNKISNPYLCTLDYNYNHNLIFIIEQITNHMNNSRFAPIEYTGIYGEGNITSFSEFSIECWILLKGDPLTNFLSAMGASYFIFNGDKVQIISANIYFNGGYKLAIYNSTLRFNNGAQWYDSGQIIFSGTIYHIVVTVDSSGAIKIYINNILKKVASSLFFLNKVDTAFSTLYSIANPLAIWSLAIYNKVLTVDQISNHYNVGTINQTELDPNNFSVGRVYVPGIIPPNGNVQYINAISSETTLVSYWIMNEINGFIINDSKDSNSGAYLKHSLFNANQSGNNNLGPSILNPNYFIINDSLNLHLIKLSLEGWFKTSSLNRQTIFSKFNNTPPFHGFSLILNNGLIEIYSGIDSNNITAIYNNNYNNALLSGKTFSEAVILAQIAAYNAFLPNYIVSINSKYNDNNWHHIVITVSDTTEINIYIDSILILTHVIESALLNVAPLFIGADSLSNNIDILSSFNGYLMHCAIYNDLLTEDQINNHYQLGIGIEGIFTPPTPTYIDLILNSNNLISYWQLNEQSGTTAFDYQGSNNGIYQGNYIFTNFGYQTLGPSVNIKSGDIQILNNPIIQASNTGYQYSVDGLYTAHGLSLECWILIQTPVNGAQLIFTKASGTGYALIVNNHTFQFFNGITVVDSGKIIDDGFWHYIVATFNFDPIINENGMVRLYVDGQSHGFGSPVYNLNTTANLLLGSTPLNCYMMNAALYNGPLNSSDILIRYNTAIASKIYDLPPPPEAITVKLLNNLIFRNIIHNDLSINKLRVKDNLNFIQNLKYTNKSGTHINSYLIQYLSFIDSINGPLIKLDKLANNLFFNQLLNYKYVPGSTGVVPDDITPYSELILSETSLISYWKLDESVYSIVYDSKNGNNGTYNGLVSLNQNANLGPGIILKHCILIQGGENNFLDIPDASNINALTKMSLEAWIKIGNVETQYIFISKFTPSGSYPGYAFRVYLKHLWFYAGATWFDSNIIVANGLWHHIVGTMDSSGDIKIYIDGELANSANSYSQHLGNSGHDLVFGYNNNINIGGSTPTFPYVGNMMHIAIYNDVLTGTQVMDHYISGKYGNVSQQIEEYEFTEQSGEIN